MKISGAYIQESQRAVGNQDSSLKQHVHKPTHSKSQGRGNNLRSFRAICEEDSLTSFRMSAEGAEICVGTISDIHHLPC